MKVLDAICMAAFASAASSWCAVAHAGSPQPLGEYSAGAVSLRFDGHGHIRVLQGDKELVHGRYELAGDRITLTDEAGSMACDPSQARGVYRWSERAGSLTFAVVDDACEGRSGDLLGRAWKRSK